MTQPAGPPPGPPTGWQAPAPQKSSGGIAKGCLISAAIVVILGIGLVVLLAFAVSDSADKAQRRLQTTTPSGDVVVITAGEFNEIQSGMTQEQVEEIIGGPGRVISQTDSGTYHSILLGWGGEELGDNANVTFRDGLVVSKAQFGLEQG